MDCAICGDFIDMSYVNGSMIVTNTKWYNREKDKIEKGNRERYCFGCGNKINSLINKMKTEAGR